MELSAKQIEAYWRDGFLIVENAVSENDVEELRRVTDEFVEGSRGVTEHDGVYDLEPGHSASAPRVRRIKTPHTQHPIYDRIMRDPRLLSILQQVLGPAICFDTSKLNMKSPGGGAAVEWHQDWAFYPHTNSDLCAVGVMMDDCELENGPLLCVAGSHKGPIFDHHSDGHFCGAIDPETAGVDLESAVPCVGKAGSISIHHAMTLHGSAINISDKPRRLLFYQYRAADAWPLATPPASWEDWTASLLCGDNEPIVPRVTSVPVRLPFPKPKRTGSIYEIQRGAASYFGKGRNGGPDTGKDKAAGAT